MFGRGIVDEGVDPADAVVVVVQRARLRRHESDVTAIGADACVVGKSFGVTADTNLAVSLLKVAVSGEQFDFAVAFESGTRNYIEHAIGTIAVVGGVSTTLNFDHVHIFWIELRTDIRGDVGVGHGNAVDQPGNLMAPADMKLIVNEIRAWSVIGDEAEAVGAGCAGRGVDGFASESGLA